MLDTTPAAYGPWDIGEGSFLIGQERAFRVDAHAPPLDKLYLSFRRMGMREWIPASLDAHSAKYAERHLVASFGGKMRGIAVHAARSALRQTPLRLIQVHLPWDGSLSPHVKLYHQSITAPNGHIHTLNTQRRLEARGVFAPPFSGEHPIEIYALSWPERNVLEAYTADTQGPFVPPPCIQHALHTLGARLHQASMDLQGVRSWYFQAPQMPPHSAMEALCAATNTAPTPRALARLERYVQDGWVWGDFIIQQDSLGTLFPVAHLILPQAHGRTFFV